MYYWDTHQWILKTIIGEYSHAERVAKLIHERSKCNTKLARGLNMAYSMSRNDLPIMSAITSALAMQATNMN